VIAQRRIDAQNPDKTRLFEFGRHTVTRRRHCGLGRLEPFTFLGFVFVCVKARRGAFQLQRKSRGDRMRAALQEIKFELRERMHDSIPSQGRWLRAVVAGYFAYHAVPTNSRALETFRYHVTDLWRRALRRRSQKYCTTWERMTKPLQNGCRHPYPPPAAGRRFAVNNPRPEPVRELRAGICAGALSNERPYRYRAPKAKRPFWRSASHAGPRWAEARGRPPGGSRRLRRQF